MGQNEKAGPQMGRVKLFCPEWAFSKGGKAVFYIQQSTLEEEEQP